jgi:glycosyltransferase involved in cell wall biosynthesis
VSTPPRLSIGLPVYNGESYLAESIESLLGQTFEDFELIISDNASTDCTADICRRYAKQDSRVRYVRQPRNIGLSPNHNFVFAEARGELFKWAAADDLYARDLLRHCVEALDEHPDVVLAHAWEAAIDDAGAVTQAMEYPLTTDSASAPQRFRSFLFGSSGLFESVNGDGRDLIRLDNRGILRACDEYGVIRSDVLRQVAPLGSYHHSDRIVVCELVLRGRFHITPNWLYFRREYPDRTYNTSPSVHARCAILDPVRASRLRHPTGRLLAEYMWGYITAIQRAPLSPADRRECYRQMARWTLDRATSMVVPRRLEQIAGQFSPLLQDREVSVSAVVAGQEARSS